MNDLDIGANDEGRQQLCVSPGPKSARLTPTDATGPTTLPRDRPAARSLDVPQKSQAGRALQMCARSQLAAVQRFAVSGTVATLRESLKPRAEKGIPRLFGGQAGPGEGWTGGAGNGAARESCVGRSPTSVQRAWSPAAPTAVGHQTGGDQAHPDDPGVRGGPTVFGDRLGAENPCPSNPGRRPTKLGNTGLARQSGDAR